MRAKRNERQKKIETKSRSPDLKIEVDFPDLNETARSNLEDILNGKAIGRNICHVQYDRDLNEKTVYSGRLENSRRRQEEVMLLPIGIQFWVKPTMKTQLIMT